jgi:hypothetical protein
VPEFRSAVVDCTCCNILSLSHQIESKSPGNLAASQTSKAPVGTDFEVASTSLPACKIKYMKEQESSVDKNKIAAAAMGEIATEVEAGIITSTERANHTSNGSCSQLLAAAAGDGTMTTTNGTVQQQQRVNKRCLWFEEELEPDLRWVFGVSK